MKGNTVVSMLKLAALPMLATVPPCFIVASTQCRIWPPTLSTAPAQRAASSGRTLSKSMVERSRISAAPSIVRYSPSDSLPVSATT